MKKFVAIVMALVMAMSMASFAAAEETIKIGVIGPMTGGAAVYGLAVAHGAQIAVDEINAKGGVQIELLVEDDEHDAEKAINAYNTVLDDGAQMILGTVTTSPCIAVSANAYDERIFMLTPSASSPAVIEGKDNVYQVCFTDPAQGAASAEYISINKLATKVGVIYNNGDVYSTGIYQTFESKAKDLDLEIVSVTTFTDETTDFSVQVADMKASGAELVFLPIYYTPASMILTESAKQEYAPVFFGVDGMDGILTLEGFDKSLAEGVMLLTPFSADADDEQTKNFVTKYDELYKEVPNQFAADAYDGVYALYNAAVAGNITSETSPEDACEILIAQFQTLSVDGLTGSMTWSAAGEVTKTPTAVVIKDGVYVGADK
ncbi:MAG: ABC transporter substrate-binding protein [Clostridia bacterium]|nr:ABC transporter substrate-binding protein [Clostridia bacterium]